MKIALFAVGILAAGVVGGVTADLLRPEPPSSVPDRGADRLQAEFSDLKTTVARLTMEVRSLRDAAVLPDAPADAGDPAALVPETVDPVAAADPADLEQKVNRLIEEKDRKESEARTQRVTAMWAERDKERLKKFQEELDLTDYQAEELAKILEERRTLMTEMRTKMFEGRENMSREQIGELREKMKTSRGESEEKVKTLLSSSQYESYQKMDTGGRGSGGGFGGGRGPR